LKLKYVLMAAIYAFDTSDDKAASSEKTVNIEGINQKIAAMMGSEAAETVINGIAVHHRPCINIRRSRWQQSCTAL